jgi:hypothetical protein
VSATEKGARGHWVGVGVLLFLAWLLLVLGAFGVYLHRSLYNQEAFTNRVSAVLEEPDVQTAVATAIANEVVKQVPDAVVARPLIESAAQAVVAEPAFQDIVVRSLGTLHKALLDPTTADIVFRLEGVPQLLEQVLQRANAQIAREVAQAASAKIAELPEPGPAFRLIQIGADLGPVAWVIVLLGVVVGGVAALISPDRRRGLIAALVTLALAGLGVVFILGLARVGILASTADDPVLSTGLGGVFDGLFGDLRRTGYIVAAVGIVGAVVVWSLRRTLPYAVAAGERAQELGAGAASVAAQRASDLSSAAAAKVDEAAGRVGEGTTASGGAVTSAGTATATAVETRTGGLEAQDLIVAVRAGLHRLIIPAATTQGRLIQGAIALLLAVAILFAWSTVVDVLVLALGLGLLALALNRVLIVLFAYRERRGAGERVDA